MARNYEIRPWLKDTFDLPLFYSLDYHVRCSRAQMEPDSIVGLQKVTV